LHSVWTSYAALNELLLGEDAARVWLSSSELAAFLSMRSARRRDTFLAGRIVLKKMLLRSAYTSFPASRLAIESRSVVPGHGERPVLSIDGVVQPFSLSISHSERGVLVAAGDSTTTSIGIDLVARNAITEHVTWTFTAAERQWLAAAPSHACQAEELWARKEAIYKACQHGEGFQPAAIEVVPERPPVYSSRDLTSELLCLQTWRVDGHVAALVVATPRPALAREHSQVHTRAA
jgi:phosphopantetheinyl transferase